MTILVLHDCCKTQEGLSVGKDLQVQQSFEDLEAAFEPGEQFRFEAILQYQDSI
jgi:hypothetical protein